MSKTQNAARKKRPPPPARPPVDALTVGWMMTLVTVLICLSSAMATRAFVRWNPEAVLLGMLSSYLLFSAGVMGLILLVLTPIIVKRKRSNPPTGLVVFAYLVGAAPLVGMLLQALE